MKGHVPGDANDRRTLTVPEDFSHGDHGRLEARAVFSHVLKFSGVTGTSATVIVRCPVCGVKARANQVRGSTRSDPDASFTEKAVSRLLTQALNNFSDKVTESCGEALAAVIMRS